ncbi:Homocysteine S-methyltransferase [Neolentinus lepideus HHB14362 ss-1]|uniref:Homocysteine S-methyltransferase n=1 Tax=Neolentinus lepideus HHB14362 ss-1 TaxID=1314782 RepID=A0A165V3C0_9AGAM|nr:Homocysteine S-methyltransferase [Neolentinus lepideus HHB14362 ss-1]
MTDVDFSSFFGQEVVVMDGGLGTTLEDMFHQNISHSSLWSAKPIDEDPEIIIEAHLAFLRAGARVVLTSTYQCSYETFQRAGYSKEDAERIMITAVNLAVEAKKRFLQSQNHQVKIALSLGPFGATLSPAQEFDGFYPPPYGPRAYSPNGHNVNTFKGANEQAREDEAILALTQFHLKRLLVFAMKPDVWSSFDCLAFETVPLIHEVKAIRKAVNALYESQPGLQQKPWWISTVWPNGHYPQSRSLDGRLIRPKHLVEAVLGADDGLPCPDGFGINCTSTLFLPHVLAEAQVKVAELLSDRKPWLVLYPNGGDIYDTITRKWIVREEDKDRKDQKWVGDVVQTVRDAKSSKVWEGILAGGCCRTGPVEIQQLAEGVAPEGGR